MRQSRDFGRSLSVVPLPDQKDPNRKLSMWFQAFETQTAHREIWPMSSWLALPQTFFTALFNSDGVQQVMTDTLLWASAIFFALSAYGNQLQNPSSKAFVSF